MVRSSWQLDEIERIYARELDLVSCANVDGPLLIPDVLTEESRAYLRFAEGDSVANSLETKRVMERVGSRDFLADLLPMLDVTCGVEMGGGFVTMPRPWDRRWVLYRFPSEQEDGTGSMIWKSFWTFDWRDAILREECVRDLVRLLQKDVFRDMDRQEHRYENEGKAWRIERLIPVRALSMAILERKLGQASTSDVIGLFRDSQIPRINVGLPWMYMPLRAYLYEVVLDALKSKVLATACYGVELWARLNPTPFDLMQDFLDAVADADLLARLNSVQVCRLGLLLADVFSRASGTNKKGHDDHLAKTIVKWTESTDTRQQCLAAVVLKQFLGWRFSDWVVDGDLGHHSFLLDKMELSKELKREKTYHEHPIKKVSVVSRLFESFRGLDGTYVDWLAGWGEWEEGTLQSRLVAALSKSILEVSENELARTIALWNLGLYGASHQDFREAAYNGFHLTRMDTSQALVHVRGLVRELNGGFLQDYGPVAADAGRLMEQAALQIERLVAQPKLVAYFINRLSFRFSLGTNRAKEVFWEFLSSCLHTDKRAETLSRFNPEDRGAVRYFWNKLEWWYIDELRSRTRQQEGLETLWRMERCCNGYRATENPLVGGTLTPEWREALRLFPKEDAGAIFYRCFCKLSRTDAATCLGISLNQLDYNLSQARLRLRNELERHD